MSMPPVQKQRVLVVDDDPGILALLTDVLSGLSLDGSTASSAAGALQRLGVALPDLILLDLGLPDSQGTALLQKIRALAPAVQVLMLTGQHDVDMAVDCMRLGAADYVTKPFELPALESSIQAALKRSRLEGEARQLLYWLERGRGLDRLLGDSAAMQSLRKQLERAAVAEVTVLLRGESGTGKEAAAEALHDLSARKNGPWIALDCAAMPENLLESELFGFERGAFTGASSRKRGRVELASGGTLFLDEIGNLSLALQGKLLRFLQTGTFRRLGGSDEQAGDVRVIAATNADLLQETSAGRFRSDLYYRLNEVEIVMPPLRERPGDLQQLAWSFLLRSAAQHAKGTQLFSPAAEASLLAYPWPGNVRELLNAVGRASLLAGPEVRPEHLPAELRGRGTAAGLPALSLEQALASELDRVKRILIERALRASQGNRGSTAKVLGIDAKTLQALMGRLRLQGPA